MPKQRDLLAEERRVSVRFAAGVHDVVAAAVVRYGRRLNRPASIWRRANVPPAAQMRTEEFLAAAKYSLAKPTASLAKPTIAAARLHLAGGVAPWNVGLAPDVAAPDRRDAVAAGFRAGSRLAGRATPRDASDRRRRRDVEHGRRQPSVDGSSGVEVAGRTTRHERSPDADRARRRVVDLGRRGKPRGTRSVVRGRRSSCEPQGAGPIGRRRLRRVPRRRSPRGCRRTSNVASSSSAMRFAESDSAGLQRVEAFLKTEAGRGLRLERGRRRSR